MGANGTAYETPDCGQKILHQLLFQLLAIAVVAAYSAVVTFVLLKGINLFSRIRVSKELEAAGLDTEFQEEA